MIITDNTNALKSDKHFALYDLYDVEDLIKADLASKGYDADKVTFNTYTGLEHCGVGSVFTGAEVSVKKVGGEHGV